MVKALMVCAHIALVAASGAWYPGDWASQDIGPVEMQGSAVYNDEAAVWTVQGGASGTYGTTDSFRYAHRRLQGDGTIIARVESLRRIDPWTKVGVMIRENLDPGSRFAAVYVTAANGVRFHARLNAAAQVTTDTPVATEEQKAVTFPVWIKLERQGHQFHGYYATDGAGTAWVPMAWEPQRITMSEVVYVGLAVTSNDVGSVCEARFSGVSVHGSEVTGEEIAANPRLALEKAYRNLQRLGNWREDAETLRTRGNLIASSLLAIARVGELRGKPTDAVLADYYRIVELALDSPSNVAALTRIAALDGEKSQTYVVKHLKTRSLEDRNRFHITMMTNCGDIPGAEERRAAIGLFVEHVGTTSDFRLLEQAIAALGRGDHTMSMYKSLIQRSMAQPSGEQIAIVGLRYMALKRRKGWGDDQVLELAGWAATEFKDTNLAVCAMAAMADIHYERRRYAEVVEVFRPGCLLGDQPESETIENLETVLTLYLANTLLQGVIDLEPIYEALSQKAGKSGLNRVVLHCYRKIAETKGLSLDGFERAAVRGLKYCESSPENEVWFWKGLMAADEGDLGTATAGYERFLQGDNRSILAAKAYYDIARTKMAIGEDAKGWIAKAKALSPCDAVIQLERRLNTRVSQQDER